MKELNETKYEVAKKVLGIRKYNFHLRFYIYDGSGYPQHPDYEFGREAPTNATNIIVNQRYAFIDYNWTRVNFKLWK